MSPDWYLDQVEVLDEDTEEVFLFLCERWLSRKREDRRIERVFYVKVEMQHIWPDDLKPQSAIRQHHDWVQSCNNTEYHYKTLCVVCIQGYEGVREGLNSKKNPALTAKSVDSNMNKKNKKKKEEEEVELPSKKT